MVVFIFGDYNIDLFKQDESSKLNDFAANCGLTMSNVTKPSRVTDNNISRIDHCSVSNDQINYVNSYESTFNTDHCMLT